MASLSFKVVVRMEVILACIAMFFLTLPANTNSAKIAVVLFPNGPSHYFMMEKIGKELISRGHEVTLLKLFLKQVKTKIIYVHFLMKFTQVKLVELLFTIKLENRSLKTHLTSRVITAIYTVASKADRANMKPFALSWAAYICVSCIPQYGQCT
jgi:hypothetical protein